jgi:predicted Rossmann fold flavoprotein
VNSRRVIVVGGGAAGFFTAITAAEAGADVTILEKSADFLHKVRISGGGRCNLTHACFDPRELATRYPRGSKELIGPFQRFQPRDTIEWFESRGVKLKTEPDGRIFPVTDSSETIVDCLVNSAKRTGVKLVTNHPVHQLPEADCVLIATGGYRQGDSLVAGHTIEPPVPSLFTFRLATPWNLAGITVPEVEVYAEGIRQRGALLFTHTGMSGPAILRLSAWGARQLHSCNYQFPLRINWLPGHNVPTELEELRRAHGAKLVANTPLLPVRLWEQLVGNTEVRWSKFSRAQQHRLVQQLTRTEVQVTGKSTNKEEFVTCGGVRLSEVNFKTMESRIRPNLYFAGEVLDIDAITGGFNFQAAWTTGWIAGNAMAERS